MTHMPPLPNRVVVERGCVFVETPAGEYLYVARADLWHTVPHDTRAQMLEATLRAVRPFENGCDAS